MRSRRPASNSSKRPRPRSLARYIAASASREQLLGAARPGRVGDDDADAGRAEARLAADDRTGRSNARTIRSATPSACASSPMSSHRTANSSPPKRATVSLGRSSAAQARADRAQQLVAGVVAERVVDDLEVVEVEEEQREAAAPRRRRAERVAEAVEQQRAVREAGERVVQRVVADRAPRAQALDRAGEDVGDGLQEVEVAR